MSKLIETIPFIGVRGDVLIETHDAKTGRLAQRSEGHNLFTNYGLEYFRKYCALGIGGYMGCGQWLSENEDIYYDASQASYGFMKYLYLTDNDTALSAANAVMPGNVTGWAARGGVATADVQCGAVNITESYTGRGSMKMVFDFPTDRANGTHKSIFWASNLFATKNNFWPIEQQYEGPYNLVRAYAKIAESSDGYFYGFVGTTLYKIDPVTLAELATYTLPAAPASNTIFDVTDGHCYFCTSNASTTLYVFKLSDSTSTTMTLPAVNYGYGGAVIGGYLYYSYGYTNIYKFSIADGTSTSITITGPGANGIVRRAGNDLFFLGFTAGSPYYKIDFAAGTCTLIPNTLMPYSADNTVNTYSLTNAFWIRRTLKSYGATQANRIVLQKWNTTKTGANMVTGRVLDTPITKDNTQTMKVTYTISFV